MCWKKALALGMVSFSLFASESRKILAVIDTGIDFTIPALAPYKCDVPGMSFVDNESGDAVGHGTHVAWMLVKTLSARSFCLLDVKVYNKHAKTPLTSYALPIYWASAHGAILINISGGGERYIQEEAKAVLDATAQGVFVVVAAGNEHSDLGKFCNYYPACVKGTKNFYIVGALTGLSIAPYSNYGGPVNAWAEGTSVGPTGRTLSGTSIAAPLFGAQLLKETYH